MTAEKRLQSFLTDLNNKLGGLTNQSPVVESIRDICQVHLDQIEREQRIQREIDEAFDREDRRHG